MDWKVHLGPVWYIENQAVKIAPKDKTEVKGSGVMFEGKPALVAAELWKGNEVLTLRDANGFPIWAGWRRRWFATALLVRAHAHGCRDCRHETLGRVAPRC
jgi:hypothetical protein